MTVCSVLKTNRRTMTVCLSAPRSTRYGSRKSDQDALIAKIEITTQMGLDSGSTIRKNVCSRLQPSILLASIMEDGRDSKNCTNRITYMALAPKDSHSGRKEFPIPSFWMFINSGTMLIVGGISRESSTSFFTAPCPFGFRIPIP